MEKLIKGKIITHLEGNNLIGDSQHGFRNKRSCLTSLLDLFAGVIDTYEAGNNKAVDFIYLDFQNAFEVTGYDMKGLRLVLHSLATLISLLRFACFTALN